MAWSFKMFFLSHVELLLQNSDRIIFIALCEEIMLMFLRLEIATKKSKKAKSEK